MPRSLVYVILMVRGWWILVRIECISKFGEGVEFNLNNKVKSSKIKLFNIFIYQGISFTKALL